MRGTGKVADKQFEEILTRYEHLLRGDANLNLTPLELPMPLREACAKLEGDCRQARLACSVDDFGFVADISGGYTCEAQMFQNRRTYDWQLRVALTVGGKEYWAQSFNVDCNGEELYHVMKRLLFAAAERKFAGRMEAMLRKRQKAAKLQELGKANVEALAAEVLKGKEKDDMDMKKPKTIVEEYFEAVFRPHDKLEEKSMFYAQSYLDFTPEVGAMMERLGEECRRADLAIDLSKNDLEVAVSGELRIGMRLRSGYRKSIPVLELQVCSGKEIYWRKALSVQGDLEGLYPVLKEVVFAGTEREFLDEFNASAHSLQKIATVQEIGKANVESLAGDLIQGREYSIEYKKIMAIVYVRMNKKWMAAFHIRYNRAQEQMMALKGWIEAMDRTLEGIDTEVALSPFRKNMKWEIR